MSDEESGPTQEEWGAGLLAALSLADMARRELNDMRNHGQARPMNVLRALFGHDLGTGDRVEIDGDEEPSGRVGFTLYGADGEVKRCGVTPAYVYAAIQEEDDADGG